MVTILVDGQWNLKRNFHKRKGQSAKGEFCGGSFGFLESLKNVMNRMLPDRTIVMWDGVQSGKLRYEIYKPYKAKRKEYWKSEENAISTDGGETEKEKETFEILQQKLIVNQFLDEFYVRHAEVNKIEADDLIAGYILMSKIPNEKIIIYSRDKDYLHLVSETVSVLNPDNLELITFENFKNIFGHTLDNALLLKCFEGDSADEIGGVKGVTPERLLKEFPRMANEKYYFNRLVEECYDKKRDKKIKFYDKIINARGVLYRNAKLMDLRRPFLNDEAIMAIKEMIVSKFDNEGSIKKGMSLFYEKGFNTFIENQYIDLFFVPFYRNMNKEKEYSLKN